MNEEAGKAYFQKVTETELSKDIEEQMWSYFELCAMYEKTPSVLGFADHIKESYSEL